ncbi:hypothetical protein LCGC14_1315690 [marine sediment metagenome]|uniref:Uncharacterized protein n=1 Tax=marine sediment metagenome TaxID=412755 RepID=A0A0F9NNF7_9ZZZZ
MNNYKVSSKDLSLKNKCLLCGKKIDYDEYAYEDYFVLFRGHSEETFQGVICFNCIIEKRRVNNYGKNL